VKILLLVAGALAVGSASSAPHWPAPPNALQLTKKAGLTAERHELFLYHVHSHLDVYVDAHHLRVPSGIGININDPGVQRGVLPDGTMAYGGIRECAKPCISPLHTHDDTGILHTESKRTKPNRLGQFFTEWNVRLDSQCVDGFCKPKKRIAVYVNGKRYSGDPRAITLTNFKEIAIVIGKPPKRIPSVFRMG
jgi:hypothetical protein